jgi:single-stranded DNA-binding protein
MHPSQPDRQRLIVAESMSRGTRTIVTERLRQRSYETKEGEKRTVYEVEARRDRREPAQRLGEVIRRVQRRAVFLTSSPGEAPALAPARAGVLLYCQIADAPYGCG